MSHNQTGTIDGHWSVLPFFGIFLLRLPSNSSTFSVKKMKQTGRQWHWITALQTHYFLLIFLSLNLPPSSDVQAFAAHLQSFFSSRVGWFFLAVFASKILWRQKKDRKIKFLKRHQLLYESDHWSFTIILSLSLSMLHCCPVSFWLF